MSKWFGKHSALTYKIVNYAGVIYTLVMLFLIAFCAMWIACPTVYPEANYTSIDGEYICSTASSYSIFIMIEIGINLFLFQHCTPKNSVRHWLRAACNVGLEVPSDDAPILSEEDYRGDCDLQRGRPTSMQFRDAAQGIWSSMEAEHRYCLECNRRAPRRSHHCPLCEMCVLRKDHHCFITGGCVGIANQRFFIVFLFWASLGTAYTTFFMTMYLNQEVKYWYPWGWIHYFGPIAVVKWLIGFDTFSHALFTIVYSFTFASFIAAFSFFVIQIFYTLHGYTMYDYHFGRHRFAFDGDGETLGERMRLVFGKYWLINFLVPQVWFENQLTPDIARNIFQSHSKIL